VTLLSQSWTVKAAKASRMQRTISNPRANTGCLRKRKKRLVKIPFVPLDSERRFITLRAEWQVYEYEEAIMDRIQEDDCRASRDDKVLNELYSKKRSLDKEMGLPSSLIQLPSELTSVSTEYYLDEEPLTLAEAYAQAAEWNQATINKIWPFKVMGSEDWYVVFEYGRPITRVWANCETSKHGIGVEDRGVYYPVRLMRPTEADCEQFPVVEPNGMNLLNETEATS